jgi:hypothetical protein
MNEKYNVVRKIPMSEDGRAYQVTVDANRLQEVINELAGKIDFLYKNAVDPNLLTEITNAKIDELNQKIQLLENQLS